MDQATAKIAIKTGEPLGWGTDPLHPHTDTAGFADSFGPYHLVFGSPASRIDQTNFLLIEHPHLLQDTPESFPVPRAAKLRAEPAMIAIPLDQASIIDGDIAQLPTVPLSDLIGREAIAVFPGAESNLESVSGQLIGIQGSSVSLDIGSESQEFPSIRYLEFVKP